VTAKEKAAARAKRDEMLATSRENASRRLAGNLVQESAKQEVASIEVNEGHEQLSSRMIHEAE
jgi:hypothetical protein